jgi:hypothetical protein
MGLLSKIFGKVGKQVDTLGSGANYRKVQSWDALSGENSQKMYAAVNKTGRPKAAGPSSIPLSKVEGLPEGGAGQRSRHAMNPASQGTGADQGFGSGWQKLAGFGKKLIGKAGKAASSPNARMARAGLLQEREALASSLAPTEFLRELSYKIRTPVGGVTIQAGGSEVTFGVIGGELLPEMVTTAQAHRRQGIASYMYRLAEEATGMRVSTKATKTEMGAAFAAKRKYKDLNLPAMRKFQLSEIMQSSTNQVKANTTSQTVPGLAMHPKVTGSRQGPQGGT